MKILFNRYPVDILICIIWSLILVLTNLLTTNIIIRTIFGLPMILFFPGYIILFALFPTKKEDKGINTIERIAFSFGLSIAIVPIVGFLLNFTPWGITLISILFSLFIFIFFVGLIAFYRWIKSPIDKRFIIYFEISFPKFSNNINKILVFILIIFILTSIGSILYVIINPRNGEPFTDFYILGPTGKISEYPKNLVKGEKANVIIGILNHEYKLINYTIEIWLIDKTNIYNNTKNENVTIYNHMWFIGKMSIILNHFDLNVENGWKPQWEYEYNFSIDRLGNYALTFLLFTSPTSEYYYSRDYKEIAFEKIESAYKNVYIWVNIS